MTAELACPIGLNPANFTATGDEAVGRAVSGETVGCEVLEEEDGCADGSATATGGLGAGTYIFQKILRIRKR